MLVIRKSETREALDCASLFLCRLETKVLSENKKVLSAVKNKICGY